MAGKGKPWAKGQSGNPQGRKPAPEHLRKAMQLTRESAAETLNRFISMSVDELNAVLEDSTRPTLEHLVAKLISVGMYDGDPKALTFLFDRLIGKVRDPNGGTNISLNLLNMPREEALKLGKEAVAFLEAKKVGEDDS